MKSKHLIPKLLSGAVAVLAMGQAMEMSAQSETLLPSTVVRLKGHARCSTDGGKTWRMVKLGDTLDSGAMIQSAMKSDLDIVLGGQAETQTANLVSLMEDTLLRLDKIARKQPAGARETVEEISLDLRTGILTGSIRKLSAGSRYEIAFVNGVAGAREGIYTLRANGELSVYKGKAFIALADGRPAQEIPAGQQFNPATGLVGTQPPEAPQVFARPAVSQTEPPAPASAPAPAPATSSPVRRVQPANTGLRRAAP